MSDNSDEIRKLRSEVEELEFLLRSHFDSLNLTIDQRDRSVLTILWRLVGLALFIGAAVGVGSAVTHWGLHGWTAILATIGLSLLVPVLAIFFVGRGSLESEESLEELPRWQIGGNDNG